MVSISDSKGMPGRRTILDWLSRGNNGEEPFVAFLTQYVLARELQQDMLLDECLDIADDSRNDWVIRQQESGIVERVLDKEAIQWSRLRIDARLRLAEKLAPKKCGPKADLTHHHQVENPIAAIMREVAAQPYVPLGARIKGQ